MPRHPHALVHPFRLTIVSFVQDLEDLRDIGLRPEQCNAVVERLDSVLRHLEAAGDSNWLRDLLIPVAALRADYYSWNNPENEARGPEHRERQAQVIRKHKDGMLRRYTFGPLLATEAERLAFARIYEDLVQLRNIRSIKGQSEPVFKRTVEIAAQKRDDLAA